MIKLIPADSTPVEMEVFQHLLQLYEYEFSEITQLEVNRQGLYTNVELNKNLADQTCLPFLLKYKEKWAGLAVINLKSYLNDDSHVRDIAEFFVMKLYRHHHLGQEMAFELFRHFPGQWEVRQLPAADEARKFWLKVIDRFTHHHFIESFVENSRWHGYVQTFTSPT